MIVLDFNKQNWQRCWVATTVTDWVAVGKDNYILDCWGRLYKGKLINKSHLRTRAMRYFSKRMTLKGSVIRDSKGNAQKIEFKSNPRNEAILKHAGFWK